MIFKLQTFAFCGVSIHLACNAGVSASARNPVAPAETPAIAGYNLSWVILVEQFRNNSFDLQYSSAHGRRFLAFPKSFLFFFIIFDALFTRSKGGMVNILN